MYEGSNDDIVINVQRCVGVPTPRGGWVVRRRCRRVGVGCRGVGGGGRGGGGCRRGGASPH